VNRVRQLSVSYSDPAGAAHRVSPVRARVLRHAEQSDRSRRARGARESIREVHDAIHHRSRGLT